MFKETKMAATDFLNTEIFFKTEYTDDQDLEIKDVKHNITGSNDSHKQYEYSELSVKIELAKDLTEEAVQMCQVLFTDKENFEKKISSQHFDDVIDPLVKIIELFSSSIISMQHVLKIHESENGYNCKLVNKEELSDTEKFDLNTFDEDSNFSVENFSSPKKVKKIKKENPNKNVTKKDKALKQEQDHLDDTVDNKENNKVIRKKDLVCDICDIEFGYYKRYDEHNWNVHKIRPTCDICGKFYMTRKIMWSHKKLHNVKQFKCEECGKAFSEKSILRKHIRVKHGKGGENREIIMDGENKILSCNICQIQFVSYATFDDHNLEIHQLQPSCDVCGKFFKLRRNMLKHKKLHFQVRPYKCKECGKSFIRRNTLVKHIQDSHENNYLDESTRKKERNIDRANKKTLICNICQLEFESYTTFDMHNWGFHQTRPSCDICGKVFKNSSRMKTHRKIHAGLRPFQCQECGKAFTERPSLRKHIRIKHPKPDEEIIFSCKVCEKIYTSKQGLVNHELSHSKENPYLCNSCGREFYNLSILRKHELTHNPENPFPCDVCGKHFKLQVYLNKHMKLHTEEKVNSDERPHSCDECGNTYKNKGDLTIHKRKHTGDKPYSCELCQKTFYSSSQLSRHKRRPGHLKMIKTPKIDKEEMNE